MESDDDSVPSTTAMGQWARFFLEGERKIGRSFSVVQKGLQRKAMEEAGFVDIQEEVHKVSDSLACLVRPEIKGGERDRER